ncbi:MAG: SpoIIE family protein phosphatase [Pseudomonadota bacterium]
MPESRILLVEDHPTSRKLLAAMLKRTYEVIPASDGIQAIQLAATHKPDLVLLDIEMPGMDGFETLEKLRGGVIDLSVPVIFITAREDSESREKGLEAGAVDYLTKPYDKQELAIKVKNHLALYQAKKEIDRTNRIMAQEMEMASQLQRSLLPQSFPPYERVEFAVAYRPTSKAGGDFYDVIEVSSGLIGFAQVDVAGHGVRSAMIGAMFKMAFQTFAKAQPSPAALLAKINDEMYRIIPAGDFLTAFYGAIDTRTMQLIFSNAAHPKPFLYRKRNREIVELYDGGTILGAFPDMEYDEGTESLESGDRILLYTDGVTEAGNNSESGEVYGEERLKETFLHHMDQAPDRLLQTILGEIEEFQGSTSFDDDVSLLMVSVM